MSIQNSFGAVTPSRFWFLTNFRHSVITPVEPNRAAPTQLSLSLTSTHPANGRLLNFELAARSGIEQSVPPPYRPRALSMSAGASSPRRCRRSNYG